jgi:CheY-like chemotaxis protein
VKKVMIVDDNGDVAEAMQLLDMEGHEVLIAKDGPDALKKARDFPADVFLIDIGLPGMSGHKLAAALRELPISTTAELIALTGRGQPQDVANSRAAGFAHHLIKPVPFDTILSLLAKPTS